MANMKVVVGFVHEGKQFNVGDIIGVSSKSDQLHLVKTGQAIYETYDFVEKEEKQVVKTKELKVETDTKQDDINVLRKKYIDKFDKQPDKRWKKSRLIEELKND